MTKNEALQAVAAHLIGYLNGAAPDEIHETDDSKAEAQIDRAMTEMTRRLLRMGRRRGGTR